MRASSKRTELRELQSKVDTLRKELSISRPGEVTFLASRNGSDDEVVVVEADGLGGATVSIVTGNYPVDYCVKFERPFSNERSAETVAENLAFGGTSF